MANQSAFTTYAELNDFIYEEEVRKIYEEEVRKIFIEKFKTTSFELIERILTKIDENKTKIQDYEYMKIMEHLKLCNELIKEIRNIEQVNKSKKIVNTLLKTYDSQTWLEKNLF